MGKCDADERRAMKCIGCGHWFEPGIEGEGQRCNDCYRKIVETGETCSDQYREPGDAREANDK